MSLLNQQRVRVAATYAYGDPWSPATSKQFLAWTVFCPCCAFGSAFPTWLQAMAAGLLHAQLFHCRFCIDRQMPAGRDDVLGELYERCPACGPACEDCDGIAVYPANYDTPADLAADLETFKLAAVFCDGCHGVVAVIPLDPEVYA
ncbi:hypothetical protein [Actinoplanes sp. NPDC049599]|uniref:hypothetical protein n=1 Tax=Actinoplanes sp. NPDC049599 TaxID=3363903 RepID=UPI003790E85E